METWFKDIWKKFKADLVKAHKSFTIWFNSMMGGAVIALPIVQDQFPQLQDYLPSNLYHYGMGILIVVNIILRFNTRNSLADK